MSWQIDPAHSEIQFSVRHMMIAKVRGSFEQFSGVVDLDEQHPENTTIDIQIEAGSISTREDQRDNHLKSADFLDVDTYPYLHFKSKRIEVTGDSQALLIGDLTISNVTREVTLDVDYAGQAKSPWGTTSAGFGGRTMINRKDWGLTWNQALETGGVLVGDAIEITIELELVKQAD